jgi:hypothetical protein
MLVAVLSARRFSLKYSGETVAPRTRYLKDNRFGDSTQGYLCLMHTILFIGSDVQAESAGFSGCYKNEIKI